MASTINASSTLGLVNSADTSGILQLQTANTAALTIDASQNVGIGTASPSQKLAIAATTGNGAAIEMAGNGNTLGTNSFYVGQGSGGDAYVYQRNATQPLVFGTNNTERMRLDSAGNLGLGVTPSAWGSIFKAQQIGNYGAFVAGRSDGSNQVHVGVNAYFNGSNWIYANTSTASRYYQSSGVHYWENAASGTAGNAISFTQAMTLDASGNLGLGTTSIAPAVSRRGMVLRGTANGAELIVQSTTATEGTSDGMALIATGSDAYIFNRISGGFMAFGTSNTERARIDSTGNLLVGTTTTLYSAKITSSAVGFSAIGLITDTSSEYGAVILNKGTSGNNGFILFQTEASPVTRGSITYNRAGGLVAYNTTSDYRAKDIIGSVTNSGALIDSTPVYMGKMKGATQERPMFIAHETPPYAHTGEKDAVDADGNPVYQQMDASALIPVMWAEIQSLRQRLAAANL